MNAVPQPKLPPELCDVIIDHALHTDRHLLAVMGLVSRAWLITSRFHLFRSLEIKISASNRFLKLLGSQHHSFSSHIHHLQLIADTDVINWQQIFPLLSKSILPSVSSLQIIRGEDGAGSGWHNVGQGYTLWQEYSKMSSFLPHLTELRMDSYVHFDTIFHLLRILSPLTNLERLSLAVVFAVHEPVHNSSTNLSFYSPPPRLQAVEFVAGHRGTHSRNHRHPSMIMYLNRILSRSPPPMISRLCLKNLVPKDLECLSTSKLLPRLGGILKELELYLCPRTNGSCTRYVSGMRYLSLTVLQMHSSTLT